MVREYVIVREDGSQPIYFVQLGLGMFWCCSSNVREARRFPKRADAARKLVKNGKHRQGWRVARAPEVHDEHCNCPDCLAAHEAQQTAARTSRKC